MARFTGADGGNNGGAALNYVQVNGGTQQTISSAPSSIIDLTIITTGKPVQISVTGEGANANAGSWLRLNLFRDNIEIGNAIQMESSAASENVPFAINFIDDVPAGTYNYSARVTVIQGGNWTFGEAAGPVMNAVELTGFKGDRGLRGLTGAPGADGLNGADGADGASAYDVAVANGFVGTEQEWLDSIGGGGTANIADFIFTNDSENTGRSIISLPGDKGMTIAAGEDSDLYLTAGDDLYLTTLGDDIHVRANDDIRFTSNYIDGGSNEHYWRMNSEGRFELPGDGYISNPYAETVTPQTNVVTYYDNYLNDQSGLTQANAVYLPVDGNTLWFQNNSNIFTSPVTITFADSTTVQTVAIYDATSQGTPAVIFQWNDQDRTKTYADTFPLNISVDYNQINYGQSVIVLDPQDNGNDQHIVIDATAPNHIHIRAGGTIDASTADLILGGEDTYVKVSDTDDSVTILANNININSLASPSSLNISTYSGATIQSNRTSVYSDEDKVVAVLGDINEVVPAETAFSVNGGSLGTMPTFDGDPLFSGTYVKTGPLVHFQIQVDMDNILTFGSGQYYVDLPFPAKYGYQFKEGCLHDISSGKQYAIGGHVYAGQSQLGLTFTNSAGQDELFDFNSPVTLSTADNFHISGTYITN
jgi:hypothetical protein